MIVGTFLNNANVVAVELIRWIVAVAEHQGTPGMTWRLLALILSACEFGVAASIIAGQSTWIRSQGFGDSQQRIKAGRV